MTPIVGQGIRRRPRWAAGARRVLAPAAVVVGACAVQAPLIDPSARAPTLDGFGPQTFVPAQAHAEARRLFAQGVAQAYAFNEVEAVRMFKAALARDPSCALCAWGVAWQLGPNINARDRGDLREARRHVALAVQGIARATPRERALIEAMALRYGEAAVPPSLVPLVAEVCGQPAKDRPDPLDVVYAERLRELVQRMPDDADVLSLWAEAEMVATRTDWWDTAGRPAARIGELADRLEAALKTQSGHTGLNHYLIHAVDAAGPVARRAVGAADRLGALAPASPHLVHMPSHILVRVGRYADATRVNEQAIALDVAMADALKRQGFDVTKDWRGHNTAFAWFAALMEGRGDLALTLARQRATRSAAATHVWGEVGRSMPVLTLQRLERWEAVLAEPAASGRHGLAAALDGQARGIALVRLGRLAQARARLAAVEAGAATVAAAHAKDDDEDKLLHGMARWALLSLQAELALADGRADEALRAQQQARDAARPADALEPPLLGGGSVVAWGDLQRRAGRVAEAESTFRDELKDWPASGWALRGLSRTLHQQGRGAQATAVDTEAAAAWPLADAALRR